MRFGKLLAALGLAVTMASAAAPASAQDCMTGEVRMFAGTYAPQSWAMANGAILPINQYQALFSLLGTTYGGDGRTTFALPDLRGRVAIGAGAGPGLDNVPLGLMSGYAWTQPRQGTAAAGNDATVGLPTQITNMQPSTALNFIICINGYYPPRQ